MKATIELPDEQWLEQLLAIGREEMDAASAKPTAREILEEDRNRLERRGT